MVERHDPVNSLGERIREERVRLGFAQPDFAGLAGASKSTQINWEKNQGAPDARTLAAWSEFGLDITFVVTGERSINKASTPYEIELLQRAFERAKTLVSGGAEKDFGAAVHRIYNELYRKAVADGVHPGQAADPREELLLRRFRSSNETGKKVIERMAALQEEKAPRKADEPQEAAPAKASAKAATTRKESVKVRGNDNMIVRGDMSVGKITRGGRQKK